MGRQWVGVYFPEKRLRLISELFDKGLSVKSASGDSLHFGGWTEVDVKASPNSESILVPFLVTKSYTDTPKLGYNVITALDQEDLLSGFAEYDKKKVQSVASVLANEQDGNMGLIQSGHSTIVIPPSSSKMVRGLSIQVGMGVNKYRDFLSRKSFSDGRSFRDE